MIINFKAKNSLKRRIERYFRFGQHTKCLYNRFVTPVEQARSFKTRIMRLVVNIFPKDFSNRKLFFKFRAYPLDCIRAPWPCRDKQFVCCNHITLNIGYVSVYFGNVTLNCDNTFERNCVSRETSLLRFCLLIPVIVFVKVR